MRKALVLSHSKRNQFFCAKMAAGKDAKWIFSKQVLEESPSRKAGIDAKKELGYRQQAANLIQDMGQRLSVNQLTINTAIVYMHRFYVYHSFTVFSRYAIAPTALFLAAKVEEQPKKLQHVLQICHACLHPDKPNLDTHSEAYMKQAQELVNNELVLLQTLGFEISVDHPHTHVVKCTQLVKASRDLSQMAYFMATNSLHLTTFCLLYKPTVVAAMCIHLSCRWSNYEIPLSSDGKAYWSYMDPSITEPLLNTIIDEFLKILDGCQTRLRKLKNYRPSQNNSNKDGQFFENKKDKPQTSSSSQPTQSTSQGTAQAQKKPTTQPPQPPPKEKKQLSLEDYRKKAQASKSIPKVPTSHEEHRKLDAAKPMMKVSSHDDHRKADAMKSMMKVPPSFHKPTHIQPGSRSHVQKHVVKEEERRSISAQAQKHIPKEEERRSASAQVPKHALKDEERRSASQVPKHALKDEERRSNSAQAQKHALKDEERRSNSAQAQKHALLQAKEEERRKRKAAEREARRSELKPTGIEASCVESPSGPLTLRIKLPKPESSKNSSVAKIVASDPDSSRKRSHGGHGGHPSSSKHAKRSSEKRGHTTHHSSRHNSSGGEGKHHHSLSHKRTSGNSKPSSSIDEAVFQKSLSDAMNKVQQKQQSGIRTVTLKRASNGKESGYFTSVPTRKNEFDPAAPISSEMPDNIFEEEQSTSRAHQADSLLSAGEISADTSTPDSADPFDKKQGRSNKVTSLFSPDPNTVDSQLMRSSSGYHSSQENDFQPPVLLQNHYVQ